MKIEEKYSFHNICKLIAISILFIGVATRIYLYIYCKDMWLDEAMLARSIWAGDISIILKGQLFLGQSAPIGFMVLSKFMSNFAGTSEYALRFLPLVSGSASGFLLWMFARREFEDIYALICTLMFFACIPFLYYSTEFKQYSTEIFVTIVYLYIFSKSSDYFNRNIVPLSTVIISCVCLLFSLPGLFVLCGLTSSVLIMAWKRGDISYFVINNIYKLIFMVLFVSLYMFYLWHTRTPSMFTYWEKFFFPINPTELPEYIKETLAPIFNLSMHIVKNNLINMTILTFSFCGGLYFLYRNRFYLFLNVIMTGIFFIMASAMKFYPLGHEGIIGSRLSLFYFPLIFVSVSYFFYILFNIKPIKSMFIIFTLSFSFMIMKYQYNFVKNGGAQLQQISDMIKTVNNHYDATSEIIIYTASVPAYTYYQHLNDKDYEFATIDISSNPEEELQRIVDAGKANGKSVYYVLFSHFNDSFYEHCVEYIGQTYNLDKIIEAPGGRLLIFRIDGLKDQSHTLGAV